MNKPQQYGIVDKEIMTDPTLSIQAKGVYAYLCTYMDKKYQCFPSLYTMAGELNMSTRNLSRYLKELSDMQVIVREQKRFNESSLTTIIHGNENRKWRSERATMLERLNKKKIEKNSEREAVL